MHTQNHASTAGLSIWSTYFHENRARQDDLDARIDWESPTPLEPSDAAAIARSLQRFELGESGDGVGLLAKARNLDDPGYDEALVRLVAEEQRHSAMFGRLLTRFDAQRLTAHWSDSVFVVLRRFLGLRTEITLFLVAETVAMEYFAALGRCPDPVVRGVARRVLTDEVEHIRFQIDQLRVHVAGMPRVVRSAAAAAAWMVAIGATAVVSLDHGAAMRACGLRRRTFWHRALRQVGTALPLAFLLDGGTAALGPSAALDSFLTRTA